MKPQVECANSPQRPPHTTATKRAYDYLKPLLSGRAEVRAQSPIWQTPPWKQT